MTMNNEIRPQQHYVVCPKKGEYRIVLPKSIFNVCIPVIKGQMKGTDSEI